VTKSTGKMKMSWKKVSGATKYVVYVSNSKPDSLSDMSKMGTTKNTSFTIKSLKGTKISTGKTYYVAIVAQKTVDDTTYNSLRYTVKSAKK